MENILFVDDDRASLKVFVDDLIDTYHYNVKWITKAASVMDELKNKKYNAIILDIMMPVPDSWENEDVDNSEKGLATGIVLFQEIRAKYPKIPILVYSARGGIIPDNFSDYLTKPESIETLTKTLNSLIKNEK